MSGVHVRLAVLCPTTVAPPVLWPKVE